MTLRRRTLSLEALEDRLVLSTIIDLGALPGDTGSLATGVNDAGQVVGYWSPPKSSIHAFLYSNGQMTDLGTLFGDTESVARGINDFGQVVGDWFPPEIGSAAHAFLYSNGQMTDLGALPGNSNQGNVAYGINDSGQVVGNSGRHAFLYSNGQMADLGTLPGDVRSVAYGINTSGQVIGLSESSNGHEHAFLYSNGQMADLGTLPKYTDSIARGINDSGQVVGDSERPGIRHAFLYSNGQMTDLGVLYSDTESLAFGINNSGQVVGESASLLGSHAFLYSNGQMTDLNALLPVNSGWVLTDATAINDSDQIVGTGTINGQTHAFLLNLDWAPRVTGNPSNQTVTAGQTATFAASVSGNPTPTVQWQVSSDGGKTFTNLSGATSTTLTLTNVQASQNGDKYRAVFSNSVGTSTTSAATLTVNPSPPPTAPPVPSAPPTLRVPPLLAFLNSILGGTETMNSNGTETVTARFFGIPLFVSTFDSAGRLLSVSLFGINITFLFG